MSTAHASGDTRTVAAGEAPAGLDEFLERSGIATLGVPRTWTALTGGVSSDIWRVDIAGGPSVCIKRALPKLKVAALWEVPVSRNAFEWQWMQFAAGVLPGVVPQPLAHDEAAGMFAMAFLPAQDYPLWKTQLLDGQVDAATAAAVGATLGRLHVASAHRDDLARAFDTGDNFHALRLDPYLLATGRRHPAVEARMRALVETTAHTRAALVHGDVSPKNILVGRLGPVILDAECAWYGDPAFDVAFCLNHLLLKAVARPEAGVPLRQAFDALVAAYFALAGEVWERPALEGRVAALLPALLLARVDGKSPVEYITTDPARERVRQVAIPLLCAPPQLRLDALAAVCFPRLSGAAP